MSNLDKLRSGTDDEIKILLTQLSYRANNYGFQELQVAEWMNQEVRVNIYGDVVL